MATRLDYRLDEDTSSVKPKILFIDDDPLMHQLYQPYIERCGYEMVGAMDGSEAFQLASRDLPKVVVMDLMMPGIDGVTAILEIKKAEATKRIPVIAISANPQYYCSRQQLAGVGVALFLSKPFSPAKLFSEIQRLDQGAHPTQLAQCGGKS